MQHGDAHILRFEVRDSERGWRTVLSHRAVNKHRPWEKEEGLSIEDLEVVPSNDGSDTVFTEIADHGANRLVRRGEIDEHRIEERITVESDNRLYVEVRDRLTSTGVLLKRLMNHYYFMPDDRAMGFVRPVDPAERRLAAPAPAAKHGKCPERGKHAQTAHGRPTLGAPAPSPASAAKRRSPSAARDFPTNRPPGGIPALADQRGDRHVARTPARDAATENYALAPDSRG